ncbi:uncharacterized protein BDZ83DRAFT_456154 [Colletotrichum acutatum]|uniref:Uncharacterized protein n=1 Tax=Glomerella acutata TaxID=27357 RepID=A0AAD8UHD5_GLOAC|nr:uncharacterized protein BDZ83DRAFT_456154 [Colletotrichum acutatum]KAK1720168.1 hypothetical protein BDZ83DRAFT_456154 [Colletotrichum acutatum]
MSWRTVLLMGTLIGQMLSLDNSPFLHCEYADYPQQIWAEDARASRKTLCRKSQTDSWKFCNCRVTATFKILCTESGSLLHPSSGDRAFCGLVNCLGPGCWL